MSLHKLRINKSIGNNKYYINVNTHPHYYLCHNLRLNRMQYGSNTNEYYYKTFQEAQNQINEYYKIRDDFLQPEDFQV